MSDDWKALKRKFPYLTDQQARDMANQKPDKRGIQPTILFNYCYGCGFSVQVENEQCPVCRTRWRPVYGPSR